MLKNKIQIIAFSLVLTTFLFAQSKEEQYLSKHSISKTAKLITGDKEAKSNIQTNYVYNENAIYKIHARMNHLVSIVLSPDEKITYIGGGDSSRWIYSTAKTGSEKGMRDVVYIKPDMIGIETNFIINTDKRSYNLFIDSTKSYYNPVVKWRYPQQELIQQISNIKKEEATEKMTLTNPEDLNYKYTENKTNYEFSPSTIFDDGKKTFLVMKEKLQELPSFYIREDKKLMLVNYRVKNNYLIIDRTFREGILQIGKKRIIIKNRGE